MAETELWYKDDTQSTLISGTEYWLKSDGTVTASPTSGTSCFSFNLNPGDTRLWLQFETDGGGDSDGFVYSAQKIRVEAVAYVSNATHGPFTPAAFGPAADISAQYGSFLFGSLATTSPAFVALDGAHSLFTAAWMDQSGPGNRFMTDFIVQGPAGASLLGIATIRLALSIQSVIVATPGVFNFSGRLVAKSA